MLKIGSMIFLFFVLALNLYASDLVLGDKIIQFDSYQDRSHTLSVKVFKDKKELSLPLGWQELVEGEYSLDNCQNKKCLSLKKAIIHYNSAPPLIYESATFNEDLVLVTNIYTEAKTAFQNLNLAKELLDNQQFKEAVNYFKTGIHLLRNDPNIYPLGLHAKIRLDFGLALFENKAAAEAKTVFQSILNNFIDTNAYIELNKLILDNKDLKKLLDLEEFNEN